MGFSGLDGADLDRLRERLAEIGFGVDGVQDRLGPVAHEALDRNETTPAERVTRTGSALDAPIRLWLLQRPVPEGDLEWSLPGLVDPLVAGGYAERSGGEVRALVDVRPYGDDSHDWWVVADLTPGLDGARPVVPADHVLGVNSAAMTLAELTVPRTVGAALDLGAGCGIQSLHLSTQATALVATDVNPRALAMTRQTVRLNDVAADVRDGSLFEPVPDERFDLVVSNPPFVISSGSAEGLVYRDSGLAGDEICRRLVAQAPAHLADGGVCQLLANWMRVRGEDWRERVGSWIDGPCDVWVIEREVSDPAAYVEVWLNDAGLRGTPEYVRRYDAWLTWLEEQDVDGIGFGWIFLRRTGDVGGVRRFEEWPHAVEQPLGAGVGRWLERVEWLRRTGDGALRDSCLRLSDAVDQEQVGRPGAADPEHIILRQRRGLRRATRLDTAEAGFVGACDGTLGVGQIIDALASLLEADPDGLERRLLPRIRDWVDEGYLEPASGPR